MKQFVIDLFSICYSAARGLNPLVFAGLAGAFAVVIVGLSLTAVTKRAPLIYGVVGNLALLYTTAVATMPGDNTYAVTFSGSFVHTVAHSVPIESWTFAVLLGLFAVVSSVMFDPKDSRRPASATAKPMTPAAKLARPQRPRNVHDWSEADALHNKPQLGNPATRGADEAGSERTMAFPPGARPVEQAMAHRSRAAA